MNSATIVLLRKPDSGILNGGVPNRIIPKNTGTSPKRKFPEELRKQAK
jgi:hypothetical protein